MSINDLVALATARSLPFVGVMCSVPAVALVVSFFNGGGNGGTAPWKYLYSILVYLACIPGMLSAVLVCYALFFSHANLLEVNALAYFLPLLTMGVCLLIIRRRVDFKDLPGFGRLSGLMALLALSFALALAIDRTRIFVGFFGSVDRLFVLVAAIFALMKTSLWLAFGRNKGKSRV